MVHIVHMIRRRYPKQAGTIIATLFAVSASALLLGVGVLLM